MSGVPAGRREAHDFLANHHLTELRKLITELAINDFGYDRTKVEKKIDRFAEWYVGDNKDEVIERMRRKNESFYEDFVKDETAITRNILRDAVAEFEMGNSIFPSGTALMEEYTEKRLHLDRAVGHLFVLKQEIQYIAETLPGDKNRYEELIKKTEKEISLVKGVRRAANKYLKKDNSK